MTKNIKKMLVDVGFSEGAVGAGVSTVIMIATVFSTTRRSKD